MQGSCHQRRRPYTRRAGTAVPGSELQHVVPGAWPAALLYPSGSTTQAGRAIWAYRDVGYQGGFTVGGNVGAIF